jgi:hypothetical protein
VVKVEGGEPTSALSDLTASVEVREQRERKERGITERCMRKLSSKDAVFEAKKSKVQRQG